MEYVVVKDITINTSANKSAIQKSAKSDDAFAIRYMSEINTPAGYLRFFAHETAVTEIKFYDESAVENENPITRQAKIQMQEYLAGDRHTFDLPLAPKGTEFQMRVWEKLMQVGYGQTASYLDIAKALNKPTACRAVGAANGKNPIAIVIPCHRVIGTSGKLTGYAGGLSRKSFLLSLES
jgi:methylated-DNA-[protein]-cysteine S-methyltransferase